MLIFRRIIVLVQRLVSSLSLGDCSVHRLREDDSTMFPHQNIHNYTWTSPDVMTHNQIEEVLIRVLDMRSFSGADCDTGHYLLIAKVRERLAVCKQAAQSFDRQRLMSQRLGNCIRLRLHTGLQLWRT